VQRSVAAGIAVGLVAVNVGAVWFLRDRMTIRPDEASAEPRALGPAKDTDKRPFVGPVLLSGRADGSVLRLTHGSCEGGAPAKVWVSATGTAPVSVQIPDLVRTLGVAADSDGWYVVGTGADCQATAWTSDGTGETWESADVPDDAWYVDPAANGLVSPQRSLALGDDCTPSWVQTSRSEVFVLCDEGTALRAEKADPEFSAYPGSELAGLAVRADGRVALIGESDGCAAQVRIITQQESFYDKCVWRDKGGLGITWTGETVVAQLGYDLSDLEGNAWTVRGAS
jgi:hypothetical protein